MPSWRSISFLLALLGASSCSDASKPRDPTPVACDAERVTACPEPAPVFADVAPVFEQVCANCHALPGGPWPLDDYADIVDWQDVIRDDLLTCAMPPPDGGVSLSHQDRQLLLTWIRCGSPK